MKIKELASLIFAEEHMYYHEILEAKNWSQVAALHTAQEYSRSGKSLLQTSRDDIADMIRATRQHRRYAMSRICRYSSLSRMF
mgnify:CR=1 FL=1